jgi:hypothetical protein
MTKKYWFKHSYNTMTGQPLVKVYKQGNRAPLQVHAVEVVDDNWEAAEAAAQIWISNN